MEKAERSDIPDIDKKKLVTSLLLPCWLMRKLLADEIPFN